MLRATGGVFGVDDAGAFARAEGTRPAAVRRGEATALGSEEGAAIVAGDLLARS